MKEKKQECNHDWVYQTRINLKADYFTRFCCKCFIYQTAKLNWRTKYKGVKEQKK